MREISRNLFSARRPARLDWENVAVSFPVEAGRVSERGGEGSTEWQEWNDQKRTYTYMYLSI